MAHIVEVLLLMQCGAVIAFLAMLAWGINNPDRDS